MRAEYIFDEYQAEGRFGEPCLRLLESLAHFPRRAIRARLTREFELGLSRQFFNLGKNFIPWGRGVKRKREPNFALDWDHIRSDSPNFTKELL